jgi:hypothetical protein
VHLADPWYYKDLQMLAEKQDRVLYELIADKQDVLVDESGRRRLRERLYPAWQQTMSAKAHGLQAQLEGLDYSVRRQIHSHECGSGLCCNPTSEGD